LSKVKFKALAQYQIVRACPIKNLPIPRNLAPHKTRTTMKYLLIAIFFISSYCAGQETGGVDTTWVEPPAKECYKGYDGEEEVALLVSFKND
jgi:hypothetical protein